jgi:1,2-diacylglycerol 3-alpha-glucosyltransferase/glucuronosyltransferase
MRIMIVSDAWSPQTNGVVRTLSHTVDWLRRFGHDVHLITPQDFRSLPCPTYPEIRLSLLPRRGIAARIDACAPQALHIATEGPLGLAARRYCLDRGLRFTTSYHTQFPQYLRARLPVPTGLSYRLLRRFHRPAARCMVSTAAVRRDLADHGFTNLASWRRGVDTGLFRPRDKAWLDLPRPVAVYVGRVAVEKNIGAFLAMRWRGSKVVIGDGPARAKLQAEFPEAHFLGYRFGEDLAAHLAAADVMVFPSRTDTFGLVNLEAMACGVPVAAYPVTGPIDVVEDGLTGALDDDLAAAAERALAISPDACRERALGMGWDVCSREFEGNLAPCEGAPAFAAARPACISQS